MSIKELFRQERTSRNEKLYQIELKHTRVKEMKILLIVTDLQTGGTPLQVYRLAKGLKQLGIKIAVCCLAGEGPTARLIRQEKIDVYTLGAKNILDFYIIFKLIKLIKSFKPDICHSFLMHANVVTRIAVKLSMLPDCKVISTVCTVERKKHWHMFMENITHRLADIIVCISKAVLKHCRQVGRIPKNKLKLIYPGIDVEQIRSAKPANASFLGLKRDSKKICFLGRLDPVKRVDLVLYAISEIRNKYGHENVEFIIIGDGTERNKLEKITHKLKIGNIVHFLGFREDYPSILKICDIYVLASEQEGWGVATAEAIAAGLIPVVSNIDGSREIIEKTFGLTFNVNDYHDLATKLIKAIKWANDGYRTQKFTLNDRILAFLDYKREAKEYFKLYNALSNEYADIKNIRK